MEPVRALRELAGMTQVGLAAAAGTSQPTVAQYEAGQKSPTLDTVRRLAAGVGLEAAVVYVTPLTREDRRSLALHHAIARRLARDPGAVLAQARWNLARMRARPGHAAALLREWDVILDRPVPAVIAQLTDPGEWARELRHVTPFAGVLGADERAAVYAAFSRGEHRPP